MMYRGPGAGGAKVRVSSFPARREWVGDASSVTWTFRSPDRIAKRVIGAR
ncbi:MAG: hypothetical protein ACN0LA_09760 [Candidatus Longimicrobiales bacterium M2_2A_002]